MSIVKITQKEINRSKQPGSGWHKGFVEDYKEAASKDKGSINYTFTLEIAEGSNQDGRVVFAQFNSKMIGMAAQFVDACNDVPRALSSGTIEVDFLTLKGRQLFFKIVEETYDGRIMKKAFEFAGISEPPDVPF
jgi:hypothetical protein